MNSKTKIIVLHRRELLIGAIAAVIAILLLIFMISSLAGGSKDAAASSVNGAKSVSAGVSACYTPGVYRAGVSLNGNAVDIEVTVDKNRIQNIALVNLSEPVTTLYPSLESTFSELCASVIESGSTKNITYPAENKYTATMLLNAIQTALDKIKRLWHAIRISDFCATALFLLCTKVADFFCLFYIVKSGIAALL